MRGCFTGVVLTLLSFEINASKATGPEVAGFLLPSRSAEQTVAAKLLSKTVKALAREMHGTAASLSGGSQLDIEATLQAGSQQHDRGELDTAATTLDLALEEAWAKPESNVDNELLISSLVTRVSLAVARGETERASTLLKRVLTLSPGFSLRPAEARPSIQKLLSEVRPKQSSRLTGSLAASACQSANVLLVARILSVRRLQVTRFDDCMHKAAVVTSLSASPAQVVSLLQPMPIPQRGEQPVPLLKRTWFWVGVGALLAGSAATVYAVTRDEPTAFDVVPRF